MPDELTTLDLQLLAAFADDATLRAAALRLGTSKSTLGRRLAELEERLGQEIFWRRGPTLTPTRFGVILLDRARAATAAMALAQRAARDRTAEYDRLTIAASPLFAELVLPRVLASLLVRRPTLAVELRLTHDYSDLVDGAVDVALRRGVVPDSSSLHARRLGKTSLVCVAAPTLKLPDAESAEARAQALPWIRVGARLEPFALPVRQGTRRRSVAVMPRVAADSQRLALELARCGVGVARVNLFLVRDELARGELVEALPEARSTADTFAVYARRRRPNPAVRDLLDALLLECRRQKLWDPA